MHVYSYIKFNNNALDNFFLMGGGGECKCDQAEVIIIPIHTIKLCNYLKPIITPEQNGLLLITLKNSE